MSSPLIVRFAAFGDVVLLTSLIEVLHRRYGRPVDLLTSGEWTAPLLAADPRVGHVQVVTSRRAAYAFCRSQQRAIAWLRQRASGPVYLCEPDGKAQWLLDRAGIARDCVVRAFDHTAPEQIHFTDWWQHIGRRTPQRFAATPVADLFTTDPVPRLHVEDADRRDLRAWLQFRGLAHVPLVLLQPGNKRTYKRGRLAGRGDNKYWPAANWALLARLLLVERPGTQVLLCGAPSESGLLREIRERAKFAGVHELSQDLPVRRLLALLENAHGMISVDTGPAHAAAALDCPLVVLFGAQDQRVWRPRSRLGNVIAVGGDAGPASRVADIAVAQVADAWRRLSKRSAEFPAAAIWQRGSNLKPIRASADADISVRDESLTT
jgi:heptosyltransferase-2/heptosyltransferase-3